MESALAIAKPPQGKNFSYRRRHQGKPSVSRGRRWGKSNPNYDGTSGVTKFMDGNKVNQSYKVFEIAEKTWSYHFSKPRNAYYNIDSPEIMQEAVFRLSYLAKVHTKGKRKPEAHDYGCSRIGKNYK